ncbi:MAG: hypothetical protein ACOC5I_03475, partial [Gemmatimonadota bacterium]
MSDENDRRAGMEGEAGGSPEAATGAVPDPGPEGASSDDDFPRTLAERLERRVRINLPTKGNEQLARIMERVNADDELYALWT